MHILCTQLVLFTVKWVTLIHKCKKMGVFYGKMVLLWYRNPMVTVSLVVTSRPGDRKGPDSNPHGGVND